MWNKEGGTVSLEISVKGIGFTDRESDFCKSKGRNI